MSTNPYAPPTAHVADRDSPEVVYAGFWIRVGAALIDTLLILFVTVPIGYAVYGWAYLDNSKAGFVHGTADFVISYVLPAIASIVFWLTRQATPGKMAVSARIVDARTGGTISPAQAIGRYLGYFPSMLVFGLGIFWVGFDARKQGWHDKMAGTVVIRNRGTRPVVFEKPEA